MINAPFIFRLGAAAAALLGIVQSAGGGMAVSPLKQEIALRPGEEGKVTITLSNQKRNESNGTISAHLSIMDVQAMDDGSLVFKEPGAMRTSASKWIELPQADVTLEPNQSLPITCTIKPPASAPPGEYYTVIMVTLASRGKNEAGVGVQYRIASGVFVTVQGRALSRQAKIEQAQVLWPQPATQPGAPADTPRVAALLHNTGLSRFDAVGKTTIIDSRNRVVLTRPLQTKRGCVFAGDRRTFEAPIDKSLSPGEYRVKVELDYGSTWAKARYDLPLSITPEQADLLSIAKQRLRAGKAPVEALPEKFAVTLRAGATRSLALALKNAVDAPISGTVSLESADSQQPADEWVSLSPGEFSIVQSARKSVEVKVQVPPGTKAGRYSTIVNITAAIEGTPPQQVAVPVDIDVLTEK